MLRLLIYCIALLTAAIFLARIIDVPGYVEFNWFGWQIETTPLFLTFTLIAGFILLSAIFWSADRLLSLPGRYRNKKRIEYHEQGLSALTEAIAALAVSDISNAKKLTKRAEKLLGNTPITHLLSAQLSRLEGDDDTSSHHLKRLLTFKETHFLAARGLLEQSRKSGDVEAAVSYAQEAGNIRPDSSFAALSLLDLYTHQKRWQQALNVITRAQKHHAFTAQEAARYKALIEYEHAHYLFIHEDYDMALRYAKQANKILPDLIPAAVLLANIYFAMNKNRHATSALSHAWALSPHPDIISAYRKSISHLSGEMQMKSVEMLTSVNQKHMESHLAVGQTALDAGDYVKARIHAEMALDILETPRARFLMADIEEAAGNTEKSAKWHSRASRNLADFSWTCEGCKETSAEWSLHCPKCDSFDSMNWQFHRHSLMENSTVRLQPEKSQIEGLDILSS